jgi:alginate O-acetyltransferase complex protein AlgI
MTDMARKLKKSGHKEASRNVPTIIALLIVWFSTGLWHGASWNYVLWGLYYGVLLILDKYFIEKAMKKLPDLWSKIIGHGSFIILTLIGYTFFYHEKNLFAQLGYLFGIGVDAFTTDFVASLLKANLYLLIAAIICATPLSHNLMERFRGLCRRVLDVHTAYSLDRVIKTVIVLILLAISTVRLAGDSYNPFIYFIF